MRVQQAIAIIQEKLEAKLLVDALILTWHIGYA